MDTVLVLGTVNLLTDFEGFVEESGLVEALGVVESKKGLVESCWEDRRKEE